MNSVKFGHKTLLLALIASSLLPSTQRLLAQEKLNPNSSSAAQTDSSASENTSECSAHETADSRRKDACAHAGMPAQNLGQMHSMLAAQSGANDPHAGMFGAAKPEKNLDWQVPSGWSEKRGGSRLRVGDFVIQGQAGKSAEVTVIPLAGEAGGVPANINLWRDQIGLAEISTAQASKLAEPLNLKAGKATLVELLGKEKLIDNKYRPRLIAAILPHDNTTWFFKMVGEDTTVAAARPDFIKFLESLKFHENK